MADSLFSYLKENRDEFESVSDVFSSDITAKAKGGDLGYFSRGVMAKPFLKIFVFTVKKRTLA